VLVLALVLWVDPSEEARVGEWRRSGEASTHREDGEGRE
jgi:hypothetical protein